MEIHQLGDFWAIVRTGSCTRAAEQLGIAQPSLSQQIRAREKQVGTPLFERLGRSVRLTASGEALRQRALDILQQVAAAESSRGNLQEGVRGRPRIGVIPTIMPYWIAPRIGDFLKRFPELDLQLTEETTPRLVEQLQSGDLDIAVARLPVRNPDIVCSELFREPLFLAVPLNHPFARKRSVDLHDLSRDLRSVFETNQLTSIFQLVRSAFGLTLLPAMASSHPEGCTLVPLRESSFRRIGYLRASRHFVSKPMREFVAWLRKRTRSGSKSGTS